MASSNCPDKQQLKSLLEDQLPDLEQADLAAHLETCQDCQHTLENLAAEGDAWQKLARHLGHSNSPGKQDQALDQVVEDLSCKETYAFPPCQSKSNSGADLFFLQPSQKPGSIGRLEHYEILEVIGRGGMGIVLKAFDDTLHRVVAIKVLAPHLASNSVSRQRFLREARAAAAVVHDHVVTIHAVAETNGIPYLVMQLIAGVSLEDLLRRQGILEPKEILRIGMQIASGLAAAHTQGLVHRDIKPGNILLENGVQRVKITDFGLARAADDGSLTQSGTIAGTPLYMAPEQARGELVDFRADLFSLGSVLYTMCTGKAPFRGETTVAILMNVCEKVPRLVQEFNPDIPDDLAQIIDKLLAKNPAERFQNTQEVANMLNASLARLQGPMRKRKTPSPAPLSRNRPNHSRPWLIAGAVLVLILASIGLGEATGVTHFTTTVLRFFTPTGVLVVEIDDPAVKVHVDGEDIVITGIGIHEFRLKPGNYKVQASKPGHNPHSEWVTISKGGTKVVSLKFEGQNQPKEQTKVIQKFSLTDKILTRDGVTKEKDCWKITAKEPRSVPLFEVANPGVDNCTVFYQAKLKSENVQGMAYLEMWCRFPGKGEFFSKGLQNPVKGTADWASYQTPFFLKSGERPDLIKLNLTIAGSGTVSIKDIEVVKGPFPNQ